MKEQAGQEIVLYESARGDIRVDVTTQGDHG